MNNDETLQEGVERKTFHTKYITTASLFIILISIFIFIVYMIDHRYPTTGDVVIRQVVGKMLHKAPNALGKDDFRKITELNLSGQSLEDIRLLKNFTNLRELDLSRLKVPEAETPLLKSFLIKLHIINKPAPQVLFWSHQEVKMCLLNLRPLRNLSHLETLNLNCTPIENLNPLSGLQNLTELDIYGTPVFDLGPLKRLPKLKTLNLGQTKITDLRPLKNLKNLQRLHIYNTPVSDVEPLHDLSSLTYFDIRKCDKIPKQQIDNLQKSLPELVIFNGSDK